MGTVARHRTGLLRGTAVLAVLLGVLAMHGLGGHGGTHGTTASHTTEHTSSALLHPLTTGAHAAASPAPPAPAAVDLGVVCLAVLAAGALLLGLLRHRPGAALAVIERSLRAPRLARPGRDRDPPDLALLSVRRC